MTWRELAGRFPEFVQWVAQRYGPLSDGPVIEADYERFRTAYEHPDAANDAVTDTAKDPDRA